MRVHIRKSYSALMGCAAFAGMALVAEWGFAQVTDAPLAFDAASIRKNVDNTGRCTPDELQPTPSGFRMTNCPLLMALGTPYVPTNGDALGFVIGMGDRVVGIPDWMISEKYDIVAEAGVPEGTCGGAGARSGGTPRRELGYTQRNPDSEIQFNDRMVRPNGPSCYER